MSALQNGDASADLACPVTHIHNLKAGADTTLLRSPMKLEKQISIGSTAAPSTPCGSLPSTPMKGVPMSSPTLRFVRCLSGASTAAPEQQEDHHDDVDGEEFHFDGSPNLSRCLSPDSWFSESPRMSRCRTPEGPLPPLCLPPQLPHFEPHFNTVLEEAEEKEEEEAAMVSDKDGTKWTVARGLRPTLCSLEAKLDAVKALYLNKYGRDVDEDEDEHVVYEGGVTALCLASLERKLVEAKGLCAVDTVLEEVEDEEQVVYQDGVKGSMVRGTAPSLSSLELKLAEVKGLYASKYGAALESHLEEDKDEEDVVYQNGVKGFMVRGTAPSLSSLELKLAEVKGLYESKYGAAIESDLEEVDEEELVYQDGVKGFMVRGTAPSLSSLELKLAEVKGLYESKYGAALESDVEEVDKEEVVYQDGVKGFMVRGTAPSLSSLELKLAEVKGLYESKYGAALEFDLEEADKEEVVYQDGVKGFMVRGTAPSLSSLELKLAEVKGLYESKYGAALESDLEEVDEEEVVYQDGVKGSMVRGVAPSLSSLELKLAEVKGLYESKYGAALESDLEEVDEEEVVYQDGVKGFMVRGVAPSVSSLELKLAEVKGLYESKYGTALESDLEEVDEEEVVYQDGVKGFMVRGVAPSLSSLELKLAEVKSLYELKFGEGIETVYQGGVKGFMVRGAESVAEVEDRVEIVFEDGVMGVMVRGSAPSLSEVEERLVEVKALYKQTYGKDVDQSSDGDIDSDANIAHEESTSI